MQASSLLGPFGVNQFALEPAATVEPEQHLWSAQHFQGLGPRTQKTSQNVQLRSHSPCLRQDCEMQHLKPPWRHTKGFHGHCSGRAFAAVLNLQCIGAQHGCPAGNSHHIIGHAVPARCHDNLHPVASPISCQSAVSLCRALSAHFVLVPLMPPSTDRFVFIFLIK